MVELQIKWWGGLKKFSLRPIGPQFGLKTREGGGRSGGSRGGARVPPYFWTKMRPEGPKNFFWRPALPLSQGLDDRAPPLSEGLDPLLGRAPGPLLSMCHCVVTSRVGHVLSIQFGDNHVV